MRVSAFSMNSWPRGWSPGLVESRLSVETGSPISGGRAFDVLRAGVGLEITRPVEIGPFEVLGVRVVEADPLEVRPCEVRSYEVGPFEVRAFEIRLAQAGPFQGRVS